jgi:hypothetical protein
MCPNPKVFDVIANQARKAAQASGRSKTESQRLLLKLMDCPEPTDGFVGVSGHNLVLISQAIQRCKNFIRVSFESGSNFWHVIESPLTLAILHVSQHFLVAAPEIELANCVEYTGNDCLRLFEN